MEKETRKSWLPFGSRSSSFPAAGTIVLVLEGWLGCRHTENGMEIGTPLHLTVRTFSDHLSRVWVDKLVLQRFWNNYFRFSRPYSLWLLSFCCYSVEANIDTGTMSKHGCVVVNFYLGEQAVVQIWPAGSSFPTRLLGCNVIEHIMGCIITASLILKI